MKNIISIIILASILMASCREDFIQILPESTVTVEKVYKTDKDFNDAIIGVYNGLQEPYKDFWQFGDLRGDDTQQDAERNTGEVRVDDFVMDVNDGLLSNTWRDYYDIIFRINTLLSHIEEADASIIPNKEQYIGEAKFLRALAYFDLVRIFGDVPMVTTPISIDEAYQIGRENVDIFYDEIIIKDFLEAENNLPIAEQTHVGRASQGAAKALLGKVYLTIKDFGKAEAKLQEVTTMGYALLPDYNALFDYGVEHHSEYIFDIEYIDGGFGLGSLFTSEFTVETQDVGGNLVAAVRRIYNIESPESGGRGTPGAALMTAFDPQDLRKDITVATGIYDENGDFVPIERGGVSAFSKKYMTSQTINGDSKANWKVIRYADVLLMLAEALNENSKTAEALGYLNQVRTRAGLSGYSDLTQAEARDKIYLERRFELNLEGQRWFDLVRTGRALEVMEPYGMEPHMTVFPVPQKEIEVINDPSIFSQNPAY